MNDCPPPAPVTRHSWLKSRLMPALILVFVLAVVFGIFYVYHYQPEKIESLKGYGYLGVFLISLSLNATLVLPAGNMLLMAAMATALPQFTCVGICIPAPYMVGLVGGFAAAIGESTGYLAGFGGQAALEKKKNLYARLECWLKRWGMGLIFLLSALPLLFDVMGMVAGALRFPYWKFFVATWLGRTLVYTLVAWAVVMGWNAMLNIFA